jgi:hypothetical protein
MILRYVKYSLLALFVAACSNEQGFLEPRSDTQVVAQGAPPNLGRVVTTLTVNGRSAPGNVSATAGAMLAIGVGGLTTFDQGDPTWLSTSVTFASTVDGSLTTRCDDTNVWSETLMPGFGVTASFSVQSPSAPGSYVITVMAHQQDACTAVNPSDPFPVAPAQLTLNATASNSAPVLAAIGNQTVAEVATLSFNASATDSDVPAQTLQFSLANASAGAFPAGATISPGGAFSWTPTEAQAPGTYRVKVVVSDGSLSDDEEIAITVNEVNAAPVLVLPADIVTQWGVTLPNVFVGANDPDLPGNAVTYAKVAGPTWVTVSSSGSISFGALAASDIGVHTVRVRVTDDGSPALSDEAEFTITVEARPTALIYQGSTSGQYSDKALFKATLTDNGDGPMNGSLIANASINFSIGGVLAGAAATNASGVTSGTFPVASAAGFQNLLASFSGALGYASSSATATFAVNREEGRLTATVPTSVQVGSDIVITVNLKELLVNGAEPTPNAGALPGDVGKLLAVAATLSNVNSGKIQATCGAGSGGSASYASSQAFTCTFAGAAITTAGEYQLLVSLPASEAYYQARLFDARVSVVVASGGRATGAGSFMLHGDRVIFAFKSRTNTPHGPRAYLLVVRHLAKGGICTMKGDQLTASIVGRSSVILSGKGEYVCHSSLGRVTAAFKNVNIMLSAVDNSGGADRIWISNGAPAKPNMLDMPLPSSANAVALTIGNVTVRTQ